MADAALQAISETNNTIPDPHLHAPLAADALAPVAEGDNGFVKLGLAEPLVQACLDLGYTQPTVVQNTAIPMALAEKDAEGHNYVDLMVSSQTGSGKTAAFLLPVLHTLLEQQQDAIAAEKAEWQRKIDEAIANGEEPPKKPRRKNPTDRRHFKAAQPGALVLCPTRELAQQVAHDAIDLVKHCKGLRIAHVVGGMPYAVQIARLQNADLVVATPGRLLDLQRSMQIKLDKVQFLVVDEADRMLDLGFQEDLAEIHQLTADRRQTMMFSATFAPRIQQLAARVMRSPQKVQIDSPQEKHASIEQKLYWADNFAHKRAMLDHWLRDPSIEQAIVFASTQIECDGLAEDLQQAGFVAVALHGALSQGLRNRRLMALRQGKVQFLVATDVAARGIDVPSISHVFNFGLPMKAEDYTHRIGRTGRAGRSGIAVTFAEFRDRNRVWDIEDYTRQPFMTAVVPGLEPEQRTPTRHPPKGKGRAGFGGGEGRGGRGRGG
ncbi:MAG: DEAD/DEAH box helicase, partial [Brachymonas denitrificans]